MHPLHTGVDSLHASFIRPGRPGVPLGLAVELTRDGGAFSTRRVEALQEGEAILVADASLHVAVTGDDWQKAGLPDGIPGPDDVVRPERDTLPFEIRPGTPDRRLRPLPPLGPPARSDP